MGCFPEKTRPLPLTGAIVKRSGRYILLVVLAGWVWLLQSCTSCTREQANSFVDQALQAFYGQPVTVPLRDTTPPVAVLKIPDLGAGPKNLTSGQPDVSISITRAQSPFFLAAEADDPEGVREVDIYGGGVTNCANDHGIASQSSFDFPNGIVTSDVSAAKPGGTATNRRTVITQIDLDEWTACSPSFHLVNVGISMQAAGVNFSGLKSFSPNATFTFKP